MIFSHMVLKDVGFHYCINRASFFTKTTVDAFESIYIKSCGTSRSIFTFF